MKTITLVFLILSSSINAAGDFGIGLSLGSLTGFSFNHFIQNDRSVDGAIAFDLDDDFEIYSTYLIWLKGIRNIAEISFDFYYGIGLKYENHDDKDDFYLGPRVPAGISHLLSMAPVEISLEVSGFYSLVEDVDFDLEFGLMGRYYF